MPSSNLKPLIRFLKQEFSLPSEQIQVALKQSKRARGPLVMVLWQYGFITLDQLDRAQQWLLQRHPEILIEGN